MIYFASSTVSFISFTTTVGVCNDACEKVARVSSCFGFPCTTILYPFSAICSLRFHTFSTKGQVVLYFAVGIPLLFNNFSISIVVPKAGMITTSSEVMFSNGISCFP